jgi:hypothetical protein
MATRINSYRFALLFLLAFMVAFTQSGAGVPGYTLTSRNLQDSINYYRYNTIINYDLIKKRVQ